MLLRWVQFGAVSPIFRTHCDGHAAPASHCDRYVWHYPTVFADLKEAMLLRDALVPYIYSAMRHSYDSGVSLVRPMYYQPHLSLLESAYEV
jgi:alpha-glucosidase (family GH31 glycosyl hydrolase)